jgi:hypothetical protein
MFFVLYFKNVGTIIKKSTGYLTYVPMYYLRSMIRIDKKKQEKEERKQHGTGRREGCQGKD